MYQALLTRRYLTRRIMPLLSALAVCLSTAMVLTTWSVMGGFLQVLLDSGKTFVGDVKIHVPNRGMTMYDELIETLEADPMVDRATPVVETFGVLSLAGDVTKPIQVLGIEPESYDAVTGYYQTLYWRPIEKTSPKDPDRRDPRLHPPRPENEELAKRLGLTWAQILENGKRLERVDPSTGDRVPAMVPGIEVSGHVNERQAGGWYLPIAQADEPEDIFDWFLLAGPDRRAKITMRVLPLSDSGHMVEMASRILPVANEFRTGNYEFDNKLAIVPLALLQEMMHMDEAERVIGGGMRLEIDPATGEERLVPARTVVEPARVNSVLVSAAPGVSANELQARVAEIYIEFSAEHALPGANVQTWEQINAGFIGAVKKEIALVLVLFTFISITAVFLVLSIFWSMVNEKTRDIGILRSLGASRAGIAWLWLRYGLVIGVVGSILGGLLSYAIVRNINPIHEWLGSVLGIVVWDPKVYYFSEIPNRMDPGTMGIVLLGGVFASALGALVPSLRAAFMDPVRALRYE